MDAESVQKPIVQRPVVLELQGADRMSNPLYGIRLAVRKIIGRIEAPLVARAVMGRAQYPVHNRIAQIDIRRRHVDLRAQGPTAVGKVTGAHPLKQIKILVWRPIAVRAVFARLGQRAAILAHLLSAEIANERVARLDELNGEEIELLKIIRGVIFPIPSESQPTDICFDRIDVLDILLA